MKGLEKEREKDRERGDYKDIYSNQVPLATQRQPVGQHFAPRLGG